MGWIIAARRGNETEGQAYAWPSEIHPGRSRSRSLLRGLGVLEVEQTDHAGVSVGNDVAVEQPEPRFRQREGQRVPLARNQPQYLAGPLVSLQRPHGDVLDVVVVQ